MTTRPVFGDFLTHAHAGITAAVSILGELPDDAKAGVIRQLDRLVTTLARYVGDLPLPGEFDPPPSGQTASGGAREARIALRRSSQVLHSAAAACMSEMPAGEPHPAAQHLADAATQLAAGRDLLHTHFAADPATGARNRTSAWAKAIYAPPVTDVLLGDFASMAAQLTPWMMRLSLESPPGSAMPATPGWHCMTPADGCGPPGSNSKPTPATSHPALMGGSYSPPSPPTSRQPADR